MTEIALAGLSLVVLALLAVGAAAAVGLRRVAAAGSTLLSAVGAAMALAVLLDGAAPAILTLPLGPPGVAAVLAIDGLSAFFLLLVLLVGVAVGVAASDDDAAAPFLPLLLAAMMVCLLAADGFFLIIGLLTFALLPREVGRREVGAAVLASVCLLAALALLGGGDWVFSAIRAHGVEGWRGAAVLALVMIGAIAGGGSPPADVANAPAAALLVGAGRKLWVYVLVRMLIDLAGPAQPLWWGVPLLVLGAGGAVLGALRANMAADLRTVFGNASVANGGTIAVALGVALVARAADLAPLLALALGAVMLLALAQAMTMALLLLGAGAVEAGAGSRRLDGLGGLIHAMPRTTACLLAGAVGLAALPPGAGFAGQWTLLQAVFGAPRAGGLGLDLLIAGTVAALALAAALLAAAMVRLVGVALLGRPRTPRASAAAEAGAGTRLAMTGLAGVTIIVGLFPGAVLALAGPALRQVTGAGLAGRLGVVTVAAQADAPGYVAPAIAVLLITVAAVVLRGVRSGENAVAIWDGGAEPPPPWLPFGDPLTQYGGASMAQPLRRTLGGGALPAPRFTRARELVERLPTLTLGKSLAALLCVVMIALLVVAIAGQM
jgi:hydrogenase-4 component B